MKLIVQEYTANAQELEVASLDGRVGMWLQEGSLRVRAVMDPSEAEGVAHALLSYAQDVRQMTSRR